MFFMSEHRKGFNPTLPLYVQRDGLFHHGSLTMGELFQKKDLSWRQVRQMFDHGQLGHLPPFDAPDCVTSKSKYRKDLQRYRVPPELLTPDMLEGVPLPAPADSTPVATPVATAKRNRPSTGKVRQQGPNGKFIWVTQGG